ncbi:putative Limbic system-associated membrane protein, partial [Operophtera brumata]
PSSPAPSSAPTVKSEHNELTVTFPPLEDIFNSTPEKHFQTENNTVVTSQIGSTALVPCVIRNIGDGITENNTVVTSQIGSTALVPCVIRNIGDGIASTIYLSYLLPTTRIHLKQHP